MFISLLLILPIAGLFLITGAQALTSAGEAEGKSEAEAESGENNISGSKLIALIVSVVNLIISLIIYIIFDFSSNQFQFVQKHYDMSFFDVYLGIDGISIYFVLLTTIIMPIALVSNWNSITENMRSYLIIMLLLETLLLAVFLVLDILLFYIFFESILPPLFILIGLFGSSDKVRASFYFFLYTFNLKCIRAKFRGSPKVLVTKDIKETFYPAWLMTQGKVRSLKMKEYILEMGNRGSKSVMVNSVTVKEQWVDGSSKSRNLDFVRCTLVAGKPVLWRKIHSCSNYPKTTVSSSMLKKPSYAHKAATYTASLNPYNRFYRGMFYLRNF